MSQGVADIFARLGKRRQQTDKWLPPRIMIVPLGKHKREERPMANRQTKENREKMSINKVLLTGNLTMDPDYKQTQTGTQILSFSIAVNDRYLDKQTGQWTDRPNFFRCNVFGNRALALSRILTKGMKVAIEGRLHYDTWEEKETGRKRSNVDIIVDQVELMQRRNADDAGAQAQNGGYQQRPVQNDGYGNGGGYQQQAPQGGYQQRQSYQPPVQTAPVDDSGFSGDPDDDLPF